MLLKYGLSFLFLLSLTNAVITALEAGNYMKTLCGLLITHLFFFFFLVEGGRVCIDGLNDCPTNQICVVERENYGHCGPPPKAP
jgi:hypothetical protein